MNKQIKSRQRVTDHGEVFTAEREVNAMCDLVKHETEKIESRFLEPACGDGNFLAVILERKLKTVTEKYKNNACDWKKYSLSALGSIYGVDILHDNIFACRERLFNIWNEEYKNIFKKECDGETADFARTVLNLNIICGNILTMDSVSGQDGKENKPLSFSEWSFSEGDKSIKHKEYAMSDLVDVCKMKFDVIIGNPPYQLNDGGNGASAKPIYHHFVEQAKKLNPKYLSMIIPARWYAGGKGLDFFRKTMINDHRISELHDFVRASDCFSGVEIKGGICYFLWERDYDGMCRVVTHKGDKIISEMKRYMAEKDSDTFIRYNDAVKILRKIKSYGEPTFNGLVSPRKPFAFSTDFSDYTHTKTKDNTVFIYARKDSGYISEKRIEKNKEWINRWKVFIPEAIGAGNMAADVVKPIVGKPNTVCTETYVVAGPVDTECEALNISGYISTKFFHFLLGLKKITQHTTSKTYSFIPVQDFTTVWTDEKLYRKYGLTDDEINFIESSVWSDKR